MKLKTLFCGLALAGTVTVALAADVAPYSAVAAPEWTGLFDAPYGVNDGWSGADGVYTVPMNGSERFGSSAGTRTLILFSDSFVGRTNADGSRVGGTVMVNNTSAMLTGADPLASALQFNVRRNAQGAAVSMVKPTQAEQWYWPGDALVTNGAVRMFTARMQRLGDGGVFDFAQAGVDLLSAPATDDAPFLGGYLRKPLPLFAPRTGTLGEIAFGVAVLPMTAEAGVASPDGYVYVYGTRSDDLNKKLLVARVRPASLTQGTAYRFWNGKAWVKEINAAAPVANRMGAELSVTPLADGRFMVVHQLDAMSGTVAVRYGNSPVGPFGKPIPIWLCPEEKLTANTFVYGAKAHPQLSAPGELLISYHVNSFDFWENFQVGGKDIYRPRFIKLPLPN